MACYKPLHGFRSRTPGKGGGFGIVLDRRKSNGQSCMVPCGQCIGCRLGMSRMWAIRCVHESSRYDENCFITLTYRPEDLPLDGSLNKVDFQKFMKRVRRFFFGRKIKFFMCGEYGEDLGRPHYHACLFNLDFEDKIFLSERDGCRLFKSQILEDIWGLGFCTVGAVTFESAAYCARYCCKRITGDKAVDHYVDKETGVLRSPEYATMSRGGKDGRGLGYEWFKEFGDEVFPDDEVILRGAVLRPPRYYEKIFAVEQPELYEDVKRKRDEFFAKHQEDCTPERLAVREVVKRAQVGFLKRSFEEL